MLINFPKKKNKRKIPGRELDGDGAGGVYAWPRDELDTVYDSDALIRCDTNELSFRISEFYLLARQFINISAVRG